jgi:hypothetical protein
MQQQASEILIYQTDDGQTRIQTRLQDETLWLTQAQMAELFQRDRSVITKHIGNLFKEGELVREAVCANFAHTAEDGKTYQVEYYNLDVVISVGYRVKSHRGTQFRQWATARLKEYLIKGFVLDEVRLERGASDDYFDELVEKVRRIRVSERRFYQKITDIYATSIDYDPKHDDTKSFFATVQNKFHYAIHGMTAAEMVVARADASKPLMGMASVTDGRVKRSEVGIAKNYLNYEEISSLNRIVDQYLSFAEEQAARRKPMTMKDWIDKLHGFLTLNDREILHSAGKISAKAAETKALQEFEKYQQLQDARLESDFDKVVKQVTHIADSSKKDKKEH